MKANCLLYHDKQLQKIIHKQLFMANNKTTETDESVAAYINAITDEARRKDITEIIALMQKATGFQPKMWGAAIVGFGSYHYKYESGREGDAPLTGLSSRANAITFYLGSFEQKNELLKQLGKYKEGKGCLYIKKITDVHIEVLEKLVSLSFTRSLKTCSS